MRGREEADASTIKHQAHKNIMKSIYIQSAEVIPYAEGNRLKVEYRTGPADGMEPDSETETYYSSVILMDGDGGSMTYGVNDDNTPNLEEIIDLLQRQSAAEIAAPDYSEYSVKVTSDPSYYGTDCTQADAARMAASLADLIRSEFDGIDVVENALNSKTTGPDENVIEEINTWIQDNWTAAL